MALYRRKPRQMSLLRHRLALPNRVHGQPDLVVTARRQPPRRHIRPRTSLSGKAVPKTGIRRGFSQLFSYRIGRMSTVKIRAGCLFWVLPSRKGLFEAECADGEVAFGQ